MPLMGIQDGFSEADGFGGDLNQLVVPDKMNGPLERHGLYRREQHMIVLSGSPHVGQLLFLAGIDIDVVVPVVFADDHAFINRCSRNHAQAGPWAPD